MYLQEEIVPIVYPQCGFHTSVRALLKPGRSNARFTQIYTKLIYILKWAKKISQNKTPPLLISLLSCYDKCQDSGNWNVLILQKAAKNKKVQFSTQIFNLLTDFVGNFCTIRKFSSFICLPIHPF